ncbi:hypothetical protein BOTBODRAFT_182069 [Botryobasidium botryosum FD-172 SS1]|uniref:Uncharacterized protein n=1 Tax=Botryobasidium botryosum (strain FD-172 SS1) TaxID=930990 RepID=A0A067LRU9_BOTB1|nr:hypothetical protein BOTBODRAFT_182069 [Botryobasidium botryosum FD-172 SS1]
MDTPARLGTATAMVKTKSCVYKSSTQWLSGEAIDIHLMLTVGSAIGFRQLCSASITCGSLSRCPRPVAQPRSPLSPPHQLRSPILRNVCRWVVALNSPPYLIKPPLIVICSPPTPRKVCTPHTDSPSSLTHATTTIPTPPPLNAPTANRGAPAGGKPSQRDTSRWHPYEHHKHTSRRTASHPTSPPRTNPLSANVSSFTPPASHTSSTASTSSASREP